MHTGLMRPKLSILCILLASELLASECHELHDFEYCIIGAGPAGLQLAHFIHTALAPRSSYVVLERSAIAGSFFARYPRHGKLISINKRWTDSANTEYSMRHDWNSLLSVERDPRLLFRHYSQEMFPPREAMVAYLNDFHELNNLTVHFNTTVISVARSALTAGKFLVTTDSVNGNYTCQVVVMATGLPNLQPANFSGHEFSVGYDQVSLDRGDFEGKRLLIIGKGNSGFETAQHVYGQTRQIHLVGRNPVRFAWSTHYVGDLRAVNNEVLDTYQLKSLDGMFEYDSIRLEKNAKGEVCIVHDGNELSAEEIHQSADNPVDDVNRPHCYDMVVRATGFVWDSGPTAALNVTSSRSGKYPSVGDNFESVDTPGIYFAGTVVHSLDFRRSAGGFVHGFRYTTRALHRMLRARRHGEKWPATGGPTGGLLDALVKRINEGSGTYQMFAFLGDVILLNQDRSEFTLLEEVPVRLLHQLPTLTGHQAPGPILVFVFEYGRNFSGPRADTFAEDRAGCYTASARVCNFLHPVIYQYDRLPNESQQRGNHTLPKPDRLLHLAEDFYTNFRRLQHLMPVAAFLENLIGRPAAALSAEHCALLALMEGSWPSYCPDTAAEMMFTGGVLGVWSR